MKSFRLWIFVCLVCVALFRVPPAAAHPMGNFSINHYARFEAQKSELKLRYVLDFAEIPAADQMAKLDTNVDNVVSASEKTAYLNSVVPQFLRDLSLQIDGNAIALTARESDLEVLPGAGGLPTLLIRIDTAAALPAGERANVIYEDSNFAGRTGWKEIIAVADSTRSLVGSDAGTVDQSRELTIFPVNAGVVPPRQTSARFTVALAGVGAASGATGEAQTPPLALANDTKTNTNTPQNRFTQSIAENMTPVKIIWGLLFAFAFGAVHALSPGHGKTMVAAYLVGSRGTPRHAFLLGVVVTITHTFGVFALGFALLFASRYVLPEKLFPALSALSGLLIFGVGLWLFMSRWQGVQHVRQSKGAHSHDGHPHSHDGNAHAHSHEGHAHSHGDSEHPHSHGDSEHPHSHGDSEHPHSHDDSEHPHSHDDNEHSHAHGDEHSHEDSEHPHSHTHDVGHSHGDGHPHSHDGDEHPHAHDEHSHAHDDEHSHSHSHDEEHAHDHSHEHSHGVHVHSHGGRAHSHAVPDGPISLKTLVALGISGGIVPCPEALVVLLAAIRLHRIGYGLILIVAFSLGLAAALIAIGMLVVSARQRLTRFNALGEDSALVRYLPLGSAAIITLIGAALTLQATLGAS